MKISDDGEYLFALNNGRNTLVRLNLTTYAINEYAVSLEP
jgi:6-phosphogluconolactonase (cycloisomerase 2 family)